MSKRDTIFASELERISGFRFDDRVAQVFPDMISRSVPGYQAVIAMTGELAAHYARPDSVCYDLGCSRGAGALAMASRVGPQVKIIAIDSSEEVIEQFRKDLAATGESLAIEISCGDVLDMEVGNADFVALNYTLQFIDPTKRLQLIQKISRGLNSGGALILSEKIRFENEETDQLMTELYYDFKRRQGYSELEISQKRSALENVLIPETQSAHLERLNKAGFSQVSVWFQCLNFCSFLAIR